MGNPIILLLIGICAAIFLIVKAEIDSKVKRQNKYAVAVIKTLAKYGYAIKNVSIVIIVAGVFYLIRDVPTPELSREQKIERQFSGWDGSHETLTEKVKARMNDADSFEHIATTYTEEEDHLLVKMRFRGKNAFGGKIINTVNAKVDMDGNVIEIISWN